MESIAMGLPAVTTDLSGFGAYVQRHIPNHQEQGIYVLNRRTAGFEDAVNELVAATAELRADESPAEDRAAQSASSA